MLQFFTILFGGMDREHDRHRVTRQQNERKGDDADQNQNEHRLR
jgi:hypothetical protein